MDVVRVIHYTTKIRNRTITREPYKHEIILKGMRNLRCFVEDEDW